MAIHNYLKVFADGHTEATVEKPSFGEVSATGDYYINGLWYDKLGVVYPIQFTYMAKDDKLASFLIEDGQPVDVTYEYDSPSIVQNVIQAKDMVVTNKVTAKDISIYVVDEDYLDPLAIGTNPQAKLYNDGTVIGSTDNGSYIKYPNGDLEVKFVDSTLTTTTGLTASGVYRVTPTNVPFVFPIAFVSQPTISDNSKGNNTGNIWASAPHNANITVSQITTLQLLGASNTSNGYYGYIAKGRWK